MSDPARVSADDYARAERFLSWNLDRRVRNHTIRHRWIGDDRLGYLRTSEDGEAELAIVDAATGERSVTSDPAELAAWADADPYSRPGEIRSPDGAWSAFVRDFDVWVRRAADGAEFALTTDGEEHHGYGARPGYSTQAVSDLRAPRPPAPQLIWSPDSRTIATHRIDERLVEDLHLVQSVPDDRSFRPRLWTYRYALPGDEHLPMADYVLLDVASRSSTRVDAPPSVCFTIPALEVGGVWWSDDSARLYRIEQDRFAREIILRVTDRATGADREIVREGTGGAALLGSIARFETPCVGALANGDVVWLSHRDGWAHLSLLDGATGAVRHRLTEGSWTVRGLLRIDEAAGCVYFVASGREPGDFPYDRRIYRVGLDGADLRLLTPESADHPVAQTSLERTRRTERVGRLDPRESAISPSGRYLVDTHSRPDLAPVHLLRTTDGELVAELERTEDRLGPRTPVQRFEALAADGVTPVFGNVFRPTDFDPDRRYPVVDANYPGPQRTRMGSDFVGVLFDKESPQALAELGFLVVTIDGRGTPNRSRAFVEHSAGRLDLASDIDDHVAALRQLAAADPSFDLERGVGIYGVSGGGFRAAQAILSRPEFFTVAVSSEGNHDQRINTASWAEANHGPLDHAHYDLASTIPLAGNLRGKLLLMHGDMDDNVHVAHTLRLADALIAANKDFDLLILPGDNHATGYTNPYYIRRMWDYFVRNLAGAEPPAGYRIAGPADVRADVPGSVLETSSPKM